MKFENLNFLYLLWLIPVLILFYVFAFRSRDKAIAAFCGTILAPKLTHVSRGRQKLKAALLIAAVFFMIIALVGPKWGYTWEDVHRRGVDIVIAMDVSRSMLAEDIKPSRIERSKRKVMDLLNILDGDRVALVAFAGTSFIQCPLTLDYNAANIFLDYLDTDLIPVQGTDLAQVIRTSTKAFSPHENKSRALILITDGEGHEEETIKAAEEAKNEGVKIFAIGIGKEEGAPIPVKSGAGGFKKNSKGELILTKLNETALQKIALLTGGRYVRSVTGNFDLEEIYYSGIKKNIEEKELKGKRIQHWREQFQWFAAIALFLLILECLIDETGKGRAR